MTIQSAIYLAGNKRKLWNDIKPHLEGYTNLVDVFTGSGTIALNAVKDNMFERVIANDSLLPLIQLHNAIKSEDFINMVGFTNECYEETKQGYLQMREDYNKTKRLDLLLNLQYRSNSNMMRWNKSGEFNMTFGERARYDEKRLLVHNSLCKNIQFCNEDFIKLTNNVWREFRLVPEETVFYLDPPYSNTTATYNEQGGWSDTYDNALLDVVEYLQSCKAKIVMSNVFENRGNKNTWLINWCENNKDNFDVYHLNADYSNSSFRKSKYSTDEVLIVSKNNYKR